MKLASKVFAVERRFFTALINANTADLAQILADDFLLVDLSGAARTKSQLVGAVGSGQMQFEAIAPQAQDTLVRFFKDTAVVTGRTQMSGRFAGTPFTANSRYTHVYVSREEQWHLVTAQGTPVSGE